MIAPRTAKNGTNHQISAANAELLEAATALIPCTSITPQIRFPNNYEVTLTTWADNFAI
jgi:hypothetical protein